MANLVAELKSEARRLGFEGVGVAAAVEPQDYAHLVKWLARGDHAGMEYMARQSQARSHPASILDGVRSVIMVSMVYGPGGKHAPSLHHGRVARYAQGADYHGVLWRKLELLLSWLKTEIPDLVGRAVSDTAPLLERDFARRAGLGWVGKNTMLIDKRIGSFTVLGALLVDRELEYDEPHAASHCGTCTRCLDACPTGAFRGPYELDANLCLSYWTIEHKGDLPDNMGESLGEWVFGCDICQDVCPWNRKAPAATVTEMHADIRLIEPDLLEWLRTEPAEFSRSIKGTALARAKRRGLIRNALHLLGTNKVVEARPEILRLLDDPEPTIRKAAAWALARIDTSGERSNVDRATVDQVNDGGALGL